MKKALQISLARTLFTIEEDAYNRLSAYLESVRAHFANTEGKDDIVADIEGRIAEQFTESGKAIITMNEVDTVIKAMGLAQDLGGEESTGAERKAGAKKLYRDTDNAVIGGVSAGIAKYFGIDALWIRLLFVILTLSTGFGIVIYLILWIAIPEAKTPSQKLEMSGSPINLETLSDTMREKFQEVDKSKFARFFKKLGAMIQTILNGIGARIVPIVRVTLGVILTIWALAGAVALSTFAATIFVSPLDRYVEFPITDIMSTTHAYGLIAAAYLALIIPLVFILIFAIGLLRKKNIVSSSVGFGLLGLWCLSLVIGGALGIRTGMSYSDYTQTNPRYKSVTETIPLSSPISSLVIDRGVNVTIVQGPIQSLVAEGRTVDIERYVASVDGSTLAFKSTEKAKNCVFCDYRRARYTLTVPNMSAITVRSGSNLDMAKYSSASPLSIEITDGSHAEVNVDMANLSLKAAEGSYLAITGNAASTTVEAWNGSRIDASSLRTKTVKALARDGSTIKVHASESIDATASDGARILYRGEATVTKDINDGARVDRISEYEESQH
ncbi:MAG TPA: DUF2807 domain-containing protein [Candidatus Paceibacterota bacterium]